MNLKWVISIRASKSEPWVEVRSTTDPEKVDNLRADFRQSHGLDNFKVDVRPNEIG
jgi:hypothetical protein